ncbi:hypothetical protein FIM76_07380 [Helicobacter pylori]|nr:hypothetical protein FIM76_07380 [Helicobacter pylori]
MCLCFVVFFVYEFFCLFLCFFYFFFFFFFFQTKSRKRKLVRFRWSEEFIRSIFSSFKKRKLKSLKRIGDFKKTKESF